MTSSNSLWTAQSLQRYRFPIIAVTCLAAGATIYYAQSLYSQQIETSGGLHRSNASRRRRQRRSLGVPPESGEDGEPEEAVNIVDQPSSPPLDVAETDNDYDSYYSWPEQDEAHAKDAQSLLLLLFKIAEDSARRDGYVHRGVGCDSCNENPIRGIRYRCSNCFDYDLCETCEAAHLHNRNHLFWKIRIPAPHMGAGQKETIPLFYPGKPSNVVQDLQKETVERFCTETGYKSEEVEAIWEQFRSIAAADYHNDPDRYGLAIDRMAFDKVAIPRSSSRTPAPNLLYSRYFAYYDTNKDGLIGFGEFIRGLASLKRNNATERLKRVFNAYDINGDGYVDRLDFLRIFRAYYTLTKDGMIDLITSSGEEENEGARHLVSSSQPISAGFPGPRIMQVFDMEQRRPGEMGKARDAFGDNEIIDGMGVINERVSDPESELYDILDAKTEFSFLGSVPSSFPLSDSASTTGQKIHEIVNNLSRLSVLDMLAFYDKSQLPDEPISNAETLWFFRRECQGYLARVLFYHRVRQRTQIRDRQRRQAYYQNSSVTRLSVDVAAKDENIGMLTDPSTRTQMEKDLRDIETSSNQAGHLKTDLSRHIEAYKWPIVHTWDFRESILILVTQGFSREEFCHVLDGFSSEPSDISVFVEGFAQILALHAIRVQAQPGFESQYIADSRTARSGSRLRLGNKQWRSLEDGGAKSELCKSGEDIVQKVTEEALNELLDPVFKSKEDLSLIAMFERPLRKRYRDQIVAALPPGHRCWHLKSSLEHLLRIRRQGHEPPPYCLDYDVGLEYERKALMLSIAQYIQANDDSSSRCGKCFRKGRETWIHDGPCPLDTKTQQRQDKMPKPEDQQLEDQQPENQQPENQEPKDQQAEGRGPDGKVNLSGVNPFRGPHKCLECSDPADVDGGIFFSGIYCDRCGHPCPQIEMDEIGIRFAVVNGGESLYCQMRANDADRRPSYNLKDVIQAATSYIPSPSNDDGRSYQEPLSSSSNELMSFSEPELPKSLLEDMPVDSEANTDLKDKEKPPPEEYLASIGHNDRSQMPGTSSSNGDVDQFYSTNPAASESQEGSSLFLDTGSQTPDPTLPQNRPSSISTQVPSQAVPSVPDITSRIEPGSRGERMADDPVRKTRYRKPEKPSDLQLKFYMVLDILESNDQERGGPGRIDFGEFEEIMQGEKGLSLGFLTSWVDIAGF